MLFAREGFRAPAPGLGRGLRARGAGPRARALLIVLLGGAWPAACRSEPAARDDAAPREVVEVERFAVTKDGRRLGTLVQREIRDPRGPVRYYLVENEAGQWLGYLDAQGRLYRYEPFRTDERFLGVHTMDSGLALLYDVPAPVRIAPEESDARPREAATTPSDR